MEINDYQNAIRDFIKYPPQIGIFYNSLDMSANLGVLNAKINGLLQADNSDVGRQEALKFGISLGDILFALCNFASDIGLTMDEVIALNLKKLTMTREKEVKEQNNKPIKYTKNK